MNVTPSAVPTSWITAICGCSMSAAARASCSIRSPRRAIVDEILGQHLERDFAPEVQVACAIDDAHAAAADLFDDFVVRERAADHFVTADCRYDRSEKQVGAPERSGTRVRAVPTAALQIRGTGLIATRDYSLRSVPAMLRIIRRIPPKETVDDASRTGGRSAWLASPPAGLASQPRRRRRRRTIQSARARVALADRRRIPHSRPSRRRAGVCAIAGACRTSTRRTSTTCSWRRATSWRRTGSGRWRCGAASAKGGWRRFSARRRSRAIARPGC